MTSLHPVCSVPAPVAGPACAPPDRIELPYVRDPDPELPLVLAAAPVLRRSPAIWRPRPSLSSLLADGLVLESGWSPIREFLRALDDVRLARGYSYAEEFAGTNGIGTTLETGTPTFIQGNEHYVGTLGRLACAGSPIRDPITRRVLGVVDLSWHNNLIRCCSCLPRAPAARLKIVSRL